VYDDDADISKVQDDEVGDGTTSVVVFACELLKVKYDYCWLICMVFIPFLFRNGKRNSHHNVNGSVISALLLQEFA